MASALGGMTAYSSRLGKAMSDSSSPSSWARAPSFTSQAGMSTMVPPRMSSKAFFRAWASSLGQ